MEHGADNELACLRLVNRFRSMRRYRDKDVEMSLQELAEALLAMCFDLDVARKVVQQVMDEEEEFPAPATLRKHLRKLNFVEWDRKIREEQEYREYQEQRNREREQLG